MDIISENTEVFTGFKKISTPFLEQCIKYNEFIFSDGSKKYRLSENIVSLIEAFKLFNIVNILSLVPAEVTDLDCCKSEP